MTSMPPSLPVNTHARGRAATHVDCRARAGHRERQAEPGLESCQASSL